VTASDLLFIFLIPSYYRLSRKLEVFRHLLVRSVFLFRQAEARKLKHSVPDVVGTKENIFERVVGVTLIQ
jgi:hypothetical protein